VAYRLIELGTLVRLQPKEAAQQILIAYARNGGGEQAAADHLGVTVRTLHRWVRLLKLEAQVRRLRKLWLARRRGSSKMTATKVKVTGEAARKAKANV
jgi:transposase